MARRHLVLLTAAMLALAAIPTAVVSAQTDGRDGGSAPGGSGGVPGEVVVGDSGSEFDSGARDQVFVDDLIVDGSACVGFDCVNNESFGFDTIRLKENNLRIKFEDTSNTGSFPTADWELVANDSANGGTSWIGFRDVESGARVFGVEDGAPHKAVWIDDSGDLGMGTDNPVLEIHVTDGDTPGIRFDQTGASGFAPQVWDVAGNEAGFFVRDATHGSTLPFRIRPGAASQSLVIDSDDDVGVGLLSPEQSLHVYGTDGTTQLLVEEESSTAAQRTLMNLVNNGPAKFFLTSTESGNDFIWEFGTRPNQSFVVSLAGTGQPEFRILANGDAELHGTLTQNSDRNDKTGIEPVDSGAVLEMLRALEISEWSYLDDPATRHMGPMAQDFHALFGLGSSPTGISALDAAGVALAAAQGLQSELDVANARIADLEVRVAQLETLIAELTGG